MFYSGNIHMGAEGSLQSHIEGVRKAWAKEIQQTTDEYIVAVSEQDYIDYIIDRYSIRPPKIDRAQASAVLIDDSEYTATGARIVNSHLRYEVPCEGDARLLRLQASTFTSYTPTLDVTENSVGFSIPVEMSSPDAANQQVERMCMEIEKHSGWIEKDVRTFNDELRRDISVEIRHRKEEIDKKLNFLRQIKVPIKNRPGQPDAISVPLSSKQKISVKNTTRPEAKLEPVPIIEDSVYSDIVDFLFQLGRRFETLPSTYADRDEEAIRDLLITILETQFLREDSVSVTGETFNKSGKTDILIRYQSSNIFVAECKFWGGQKLFHNTIDQLLRYLAWRDSKAVILIFVRNKDMTSTIKAIKQETPNHPKWLSTIDDSEASTFRYRFRLEGEDTILLTVMAFHFPSKT